MKTLLVAPFLGILMAAAAVAQKVPPAPTPPTIAPAHSVRAPDPDAGPVKASGSFDHLGRQVRIDLLVRPTVAAIRIRMGDADNILPISTSSTAISLLVDRRLAFLWPALIEWGGADLGKFRALHVASMEAAYNAGHLVAPPGNTFESIARPKTRQLLQYSESLWLAGYHDKARALVETARAELVLKSDRERIEWTMLSVRLISDIDNEGRHDEAIRLLIEAKAVLGADSPYAINFDINRAAYLAESGRSAEALALDKALEGQFTANNGGKYGDGNENMASSARQFAWIRACALTGLGRAEEAKGEFVRVLSEPDPTDRVFQVPANARIRLRAYVCMKDVDGIVRELLAEMERMPIFPRALLWMTPGARMDGVDPVVLAAVRADPRMVAAVAGRIRPLPAALGPALNAWAHPS